MNTYMDMELISVYRIARPLTLLLSSRKKEVCYTVNAKSNTTIILYIYFFLSLSLGGCFAPGRYVNMCEKKKLYMYSSVGKYIVSLDTVLRYILKIMCGMIGVKTNYII